MGGVVGGAQAGVFRVADEDDAGAVGLGDLQGVADGVEVGFVAQAPATAEDAVGGTRPGMHAVVVTNNFQTKHTGQRRQVDLALILVAGDDVDGVAGALIGAAAVAKAGGTITAAGRAGISGATLGGGDAIYRDIVGSVGGWAEQKQSEEDRNQAHGLRSCVDGGKPG